MQQAKAKTGVLNTPVVSNRILSDNDQDRLMELYEKDMGRDTLDLSMPLDSLNYFVLWYSIKKWVMETDRLAGEIKAIFIKKMSEMEIQASRVK